MAFPSNCLVIFKMTYTIGNLQTDGNVIGFALMKKIVYRIFGIMQRLSLQNYN